MIIVLIHWKIKPDQEMVDKFLQFWRQTAVVEDCRGLIGEFLTEAQSTAECSWIMWQLTGCEGKYRSFINVGDWNSVNSFQQLLFKERFPHVVFGQPMKLRQVGDDRVQFADPQTPMLGYSDVVAAAAGRYVTVMRLPLVRISR